ncbi:DUF4169 family protein [Pseudoroseomonas globiformis]|uniref:DUF4169 family protein n=1 Tax=Teichococcus globiformis TaxID=2307229 RepID=A0ABV7G1S9_9PROT
MAEIVNLNRRRKQAVREAEARQAAANRDKFGRTKAERARDAEAEARRNALLDGVRQEPETLPRG